MSLLVTVVDGVCGALYKIYKTEDIERVKIGRSETYHFYIYILVEIAEYINIWFPHI